MEVVLGETNARDQHFRGDTATGDDKLRSDARSGEKEVFGLRSQGLLTEPGSRWFIRVEITLNTKSRDTFKAQNGGGKSVIYLSAIKYRLRQFLCHQIYCSFPLLPSFSAFPYFTFPYPFFFFYSN